MRITFDTNVVLDVLLDREPHSRHAARLLAGVETGRLTGLLCATTVTTIACLVDREHGRERTRTEVGKLLGLFEVAAVNRAVLDSALGAGFDDFEDAVLHEAARHALADGIVTRNTRDFGPASLAVYLPGELMAALDAAEAE